MKRIIYIIMFLAMSFQAFAQDITVKGTVKDENGEPIPGAAVVDKQNGKNGVVTDIDGKFTITVAAEGFLEISSLGFATLLEAVDSRKEIAITLKTENSKLDEVVVIAYGTAKKSDLTGAVATVDMKSVQDVPSSSISSALQGRIAGAEFISSTGEPGTSASIQIRGARSISAGNEPLIVVDGVVDAVSDLNELNPSDIKSISVLKDVSSTALYGSRGANGVILITTNSPVSSNLSIKLKVSAGVSQIAGKLDLMNASEFGEYCNMVKYFESGLQNQPQTSSNYYFADPSTLGQGTDWIKTLSQTGVYQDYNLSVSGGTKVTRVDTNFSYNDTKGVVIGSGFKRLTGRVLVESHPAKWVRLGIRLYYAHRKTDKTSANISGTDNKAAIYLVPFLTKEDTWNSYGSEVSSGGSVFDNPYLVAQSVSNVQNQENINLMPYVRFFMGRYTQFVTKFSYNYDLSRRFYYSPSTLPLAQRLQTGGTAASETSLNHNYLSESTLTFTRTFKKKHYLDLLAGFTVEHRNYDYTYLRGVGYMDDNVTAKNMGSLPDERNLTVNNYETIRSRMSVLARINYNYRKRYYVTFTARADGASNFAPDRKWGFFPAAALRWNIRNERFMKSAKWLDELSLRVSAGRSGNDAISPYMSIPTLTAARSSWMLGDYRPISYYSTRLANSNLTWETTDSYNVGLNFSAFKERLILEVDAYHSRTYDLLLAMKTNHVTGYDTYFTNLGSTTNTGVEVTLTTRNISTRKFSWTTALTLTHNRQMVENVGDDRLVGTYYNPRNTTQPLYGYRNGYPVNALWGYQYAGVWHSQDEIDRNAVSRTYATNTTPALGECRYMDINHDGLLDQNDLVYQGSSDPIIYGGFQNTFTWKNLTLKAYLSYSLGGKIYNLSEFWNGSGTRAYNKYRYMLDSWHPERNPKSDIPRAGYEDLVGSDRMIYDASYLRIKELSISYRFNLPARVKWCRNIVVGFSAENVWLWKNYTGFDPDVSTSSAARRIDTASFPRPRTFVFNVNFTY